MKLVNPKSTDNEFSLSCKYYQVLILRYQSIGRFIKKPSGWVRTVFLFYLTVKQPTNMISAIILAAGSSGRMGNKNKLLLPFQGHPLLTTTVNRIREADLYELILVTGYQAPLIETAVREFFPPTMQTTPEPAQSLPPAQATPQDAQRLFRIVHNPSFSTGLTGSIQAGVNIATGQGYMICHADMIALTTADYRLLKEGFETAYSSDPQCIIQPVFQGQKGNPVLFSAYYREAILSHPHPGGCKEIVRSHSAHVKSLAMPSDTILRDIDLPDDYQRLVDEG